MKDDFIDYIKELKSPQLTMQIDKKLSEFSSYKNKSNQEWFSELCFCILTANSKAITALAVQDDLGIKGFTSFSQDKISSIIKKNGHRFHNNKAKYIVEARKYKDNIKDLVTEIAGKGHASQKKARNFIASHVKGIGYKEASHFLRNIGYFNLAILDRHILNVMSDYDIIKKPNSLTKKTYVKIENEFLDLAHNLDMLPARLDFYMWYSKAGKILK